MGIKKGSGGKVQGSRENNPKETVKLPALLGGTSQKGTSLW